MIIKKNPFKYVRKRDGRLVQWDHARITNAIYKAMRVTGEGNLEKDPQNISDRVVSLLIKRYHSSETLNIEDIQDIVEDALILSDLSQTAKAYIVYRRERAQFRDARKNIPEHVKELTRKSKQYFRNQLGEFIYYRTYSRWIEDEGRRETWTETVDRFVNFMKENLGDKLNDKEYEEIRQGILNHETMPSMRLLQFSGKAARKTNVCAYNCSFIAPKRLEDFAEVMYICMCGTGVGFSVESRHVQQLPIIKIQTGEKLKSHPIEDSKEGWCNALMLGLKTWYSGKDIDFDFSQLRPAGARLKTMGGRSAGPEPLREMLTFARNKILFKQGKRLSNLDVHDIICKIGEIVISGGVRRSALISLSDLDDVEMRKAKDGKFYMFEPQRSMANNSAAYNRKPSAHEFMEEWLALAKSGTGERGIFNRAGLENQLPERRWKTFVNHWADSGINPCGEIVLRNKQFCNLTEVVCRFDDTKESLLSKIRIATILGTYQASLTNFPYLSKEWKKNCEEERLLGVSLTGQWDSPAVRDLEVLKALREEAIKVNKEYAKRLGINESTCITCVKPSGNLSQTVDSSSGMHPRWSEYYIRRVRVAATDPLFHMLRDQKFPHKPEVGMTDKDATTYVLEFPVKSPEGTKVFKDDISAIGQLEYWKMVKENFTEHNPSVTVYIGDEEWLETANWLYKNWDKLGGLAFLPKKEHYYALAPYEAINKDEYDERVSQMPEIDFSHIVGYEKEDTTDAKSELACIGGVCEIDDLTTEGTPHEHGHSQAYIHDNQTETA